MRTLVSIQRITNIHDIPNADAIQVCDVLGWHVVIKKDEFKVNDLVVYFETDSLLPLVPDFEFLKANGTKKTLLDGKIYEGYRLRTVKIRGTVSQGLVMPLSFLKNNRTFVEGEDVTELAGVIKYEPIMPTCLSGIAKGAFPSFVSKSDETRVQDVPQIPKRYKGMKFIMTEKIDGTSMTAFIKDDELHVCSRTLDLMETEGNTHWKVARQLKLEEKLRVAGGERYVLQGELCGMSIQGNSLGINGFDCLFFNVYDREETRYLNHGEFLDFCKKYKLTAVPFLGVTELPDSVDELVKLATRKSIINPKIWAEGIVFRPEVEKYDENLGRLSFKVLNPNYLLECEE